MLTILVRGRRAPQGREGEADAADVERETYPATAQALGEGKEEESIDRVYIHVLTLAPRPLEIHRNLL